MSSLGRARLRLLPLIDAEMRRVMGGYAAHGADDGFAAEASGGRHSQLSGVGAPDHFAMMRYHLGWVDADFAEVDAPTGKRLRPLIAMLVAQAFGAGAECALPVAVALELLHNFTLIHDDIEDGDAIRHHRPTVWSLWGESQGINVGDGMHVLATLSLYGLDAHGVPPARTLSLARRFARASLTITEGQHLDLAFVTAGAVSPAAYLDMIARKSAALLACAGAMGAEVAGADMASISAMEAFGFALGLGFQIRDDILGVWGDETATGKPTSDLVRRKRSLPIVHATASVGSDTDRKIMLAFLSGTGRASEEEVGAVQAVLRTADSRAHCEAMVQRYSADALRSLTELPLGEPREALTELVQMLETRTA